mgnify:CR=1 FL=1|jgi:hypothetical protein
MQNGKGDRNRISNYKKYNENWNLIFSKKKSKKINLFKKKKQNSEEE